VTGSKFRVQACPGATGCGYEIMFTFYELGFSSAHPDRPSLGQGFKGYKMMISPNLYSMVWMGRFHPLGETWDSTRLTRNKTNLFDIFDAHSDSTAEYDNSLFDPEKADFSDNLRQLLKDEIFGLSLLIIDRLELLPGYRGQNLGLIIMRRLIERFSTSAGVVAIKPFPYKLIIR
jgi:hypothetical protein